MARARGLLVAGVIGLAGVARAQTAIALSVDSDFVFRGTSLSGGRPDASLSLDHDGPGGWYGGLSATAYRHERSGGQAAWFAHVGRAGRTPAGLSWEVGATAAHFSAYARRDYAEVYAGLLGPHGGGRLYLAPSYFGSGVRTLYAEWTGVATLPHGWRLYAHAGALMPLDDAATPASKRARVDARIGVAAAIGPAELRLAWVGASDAAPYPAAYAERRHTWVLSAAYAF